MELGSFLIKRVVGELQIAFPEIVNYCTLSPMPGFRTWFKGVSEKAVSQIVPDQDKKALFDLSNASTVKGAIEVSIGERGGGTRMPWR